MEVTVARGTCSIDDHAPHVGTSRAVQIGDASVCTACFGRAVVRQIRNERDRAWERVERAPGFDINEIDEEDDEAYYWQVSPFEEFIDELRAGVSGGDPSG